MLVPQSPCTNRPSQVAYWAGSGRSSPSARRCADTCCSVAAGPTRRRAGSPGASRRRKNMSVSTPKTTAAPLSARRSSRNIIAGISCLAIPAASEIASGVLRRPLAALIVAVSLPACQPEASRRGATVLFASGADLQSINPLLTQHPLARQVQRYVLLTTLARYDSALVPQPYLAREWRWGGGRRTLTFVLQPDVRWHDGGPTTARDVVWTLDAARDPETGYPRLTDARAISEAAATSDSTA